MFGPFCLRIYNKNWATPTEKANWLPLWDSRTEIRTHQVNVDAHLPAFAFSHHAGVVHQQVDVVRLEELRGF